MNKLSRQILLLVILPIALGTASFLFLRSDYFKQWQYNKPLVVALKNGDYAGVKYWVSQGADVNMSVFRNNAGAFNTPLLLAIQHRDVVAAQEFIRRGASLGFTHWALNSSGQWVYTSHTPDDYPLWVAIQNRDEPMVNLLLKSGAKTNEEIDSHGWTAHELVESGCAEKPTPKCKRIVALLNRYWQPHYDWQVRPK